GVRFGNCGSANSGWTREECGRERGDGEVECDQGRGDHGEADVGLVQLVHELPCVPAANTNPKAATASMVARGHRPSQTATGSRNETGTATIVSASDSVLTPSSVTPLSPWLCSEWVVRSPVPFSPPASRLCPSTVVGPRPDSSGNVTAGRVPPR